MSQLSAFPLAGRYRRYRGWLVGIPFLLLAAWCLLGGLDGIWHHSQESPSRPYRLACATLLVLLGALQFKALANHLPRWQTVREPARPASARAIVAPPTNARSPAAIERLYCNRMFYQRLFLGTAASYLLVLALGPDPHLRYVFRVAVAGWYTLVLCATLRCPAMQTVTTTVSHGWRGLQYSLHWSNLERLCFGIFLALALTEGVLRSTDGFNQSRTPAAYVARTLRLPPGLELRGQRVNQLGYWDQEFEPATGARFRIAVLGDGVTLSGSGQLNPFSQLEQRLPELEVYNFGLPQAGPREYAAQIADEVAAFAPNLVMVFLTVGDDITQPLPLPDKYDWHSLRLVQWSNRLVNATPNGNALAALMATKGEPARRDYDAYLAAHAPRLEVCRTPISQELERHWQEAFDQLDRLTTACRNSDLPLAVVLVPEQFQVNAQVYDALRRRLGYSREQVDLELPQRRLAVYAAEHDLPLLDLLPSFRAAASSPFAVQGLDWNAAGQQIATDTLDAWLKSQFADQLNKGTTSLAVREE